MKETNEDRRAEMNAKETKEVKQKADTWGRISYKKNLIWSASTLKLFLIIWEMMGEIHLRCNTSA